jgi:hypothetical protein
MQFTETPVQIIKSFIRMFVFSCFLENAVQEGRINPESFRERIRLDEGGRGVDFSQTYAVDELKINTGNLVLITLGTTAISMNKALEVVYGKQFDATDTSPEGSARVLIYQIRCAFAHDPLNPVWTPDAQRYDHQYRIKVKVNRPTGEPVTDREISFHPPSLKGKRLVPADIGGWGGFLGLLHYYLAKVETHVKGNAPYIPSLEGA